MKRKIKTNLRIGILTLLPIIVFISIVKWILSMVFGVSDKLLILMSMNDVINFQIQQNLWYWKIISIVVLMVVTWGIGLLMNHYYMGKKIKKFFQRIIRRIPILNTLFRMSEQINKISTNRTSFKEVVLVEFPAPGLYTVGFITSDRIEIIEKILDSKEVYSVFIPTTPNPTNGYLCIVNRDKLIKTKISIGTAIEYIISMGTLINLEEIQEMEKKGWFYLITLFIYKIIYSLCFLKLIPYPTFYL